MIFNPLMSASLLMHSYLSTLLLKRYSAQENFNKILRYAFCLLNAIIAPNLIFYLGVNSVGAYIGITVILIMESFLLFKDKVIAIIALDFGILLHLFAIRSIILSVHALIIDKSIVEILKTPELLFNNTLMVLITHIIVLIIFLSVFTPEAVKEIIANKTLLYFIAFQLITLGLFFIYNSDMLSVDDHKITIQQIVLPIVLLGTFYAVLVFMISLVTNDSYKKIIEELENKIDENELITQALFGLTNMIIEFNVTQDKIIRVLADNRLIDTEENLSYTNFFNDDIFPRLYYKDNDNIIQMSAKNIKSEFLKGVNELSFEYRANKIDLTKSTDVKDTVGNDDFIWYRMMFISKEDETTKDIISICTIDEIEEEKQAEITLKNKSQRDSLTGAYNKGAIKAKVEKYLLYNKQGALFVFDIDNFKGVNDTFGHAFGDEVLCDVYEIISGIFREGDYVARFGGDEFVVFVKGEIPKHTLNTISKRLCDALEKTYEGEDGKTVDISTSIGIALVNNTDISYEDLFKFADKALYQSKNLGKNTFTIHNEESKTI